MAENSPDEAADAADQPRGYSAKPPLWQPKPKPPTSPIQRVAIGVIALLAFGFILVMLEASLLSMPVGQTEITVVEVQTGQPRDEGPASYRHLVQMPDGTTRNFVSERIHRPGERLLVTLNRGMLTRRVRLGAPYIVVAVPADPSSEVDSRLR